MLFEILCEKHWEMSSVSSVKFWVWAHGEMLCVSTEKYKHRECTVLTSHSACSYQINNVWWRRMMINLDVLALALAVPQSMFQPWRIMFQYSTAPQSSSFVFVCLHLVPKIQRVWMKSWTTYIFNSCFWYYILFASFLATWIILACRFRASLLYVYAPAYVSECVYYTQWVSNSVKDERLLGFHPFRARHNLSRLI